MVIPEIIDAGVSCQPVFREYFAYLAPETGLFFGPKRLARIFHLASCLFCAKN